MAPLTQYKVEPGFAIISQASTLQSSTSRASTLLGLNLALFIIPLPSSPLHPGTLHNRPLTLNTATGIISSPNIRLALHFDLLALIASGPVTNGTFDIVASSPETLRSQSRILHPRKPTL